MQALVANWNGGKRVRRRLFWNRDRSRSSNGDVRLAAAAILGSRWNSRRCSDWKGCYIRVCNYVIIIGCMSLGTPPVRPSWQDYVQPTVAILNSDLELIEGPSRVSLSCPIRKMSYSSEEETDISDSEMEDYSETCYLPVSVVNSVCSKLVV
ncbi:hypothetical protein OROMI_016499 [Orobanche minor]